MTSFANYGELKTSVQAWARRADTPNVIDLAKDIAEERMSRELKGWYTQKTGSLAYSIGATFVALPADLLELKSMSISNQDLMPVSPEMMHTLLRTGGMGNQVLLEEGKIKFGTAKTVAGTVDILYKAENATTLSADIDTNWILTKHPLVYFYGILSELDDRIKVDTVWRPKYQEAVNIANRQVIYTGLATRTSPMVVR